MVQSGRGSNTDTDAESNTPMNFGYVIEMDE